MTIVRCCFAMLDDVRATDPGGVSTVYGVHIEGI